MMFWSFPEVSREFFLLFTCHPSDIYVTAYVRSVCPYFFPLLSVSFSSSSSVSVSLRFNLSVFSSHVSAVYM